MRIDPILGGRATSQLRTPMRQLRARTVQGLTCELGRRWGLPDLPARVEVTFSLRLTRRLGRALPARGQVRLSAALQGADSSLLREVLSHELAHVVVFLRHGAWPKPHGRQWRALVEQAGFTPRTSLAVPHGELPQGREPAYLHVCPVCQATRCARRPMRRWRCASCVANGLEGTLVIEQGSR